MNLVIYKNLYLKINKLKKIMVNLKIDNNIIIK